MFVVTNMPNMVHIFSNRKYNILWEKENIMCLIFIVTLKVVQFKLILS